MSALILMVLLLLALVALFFASRQLVAFCLTLALAWLILIGSYMFPGKLMHQLQQIKQENHAWQDKNAIIILGGGIVFSDVDKRYRVGPGVYSRLFVGARLWFSCKKQLQKCRIFVTGGDPTQKGVSEAAVMAQELIELGVNQGDLFIEGSSLNTYQNARNLLKPLRDEKINGLWLVSSGFHLQRAKRIFQSMGLEVVPVPSDYIELPLSRWPTAYAQYIFDLALHEYLGIAQFELFQWLGLNQNATTHGTLGVLRWLFK